MPVSFVLLISPGLELSFPSNPAQVLLCVVPPPPRAPRAGSRLISFSFLVRTGPNRLQAGGPEPRHVQMWVPGQHPSQTRYPWWPRAGPWGLPGRWGVQGVWGDAWAATGGSISVVLGAGPSSDTVKLLWGGICSGPWTSLVVPTHRCPSGLIWGVEGSKGNNALPVAL